MGSPIIYNTLPRPAFGILSRVWMGIFSSSSFFPLAAAMARVSNFMEDTFTFSSDLNEWRWLGLGLGLVY